MPAEAVRQYFVKHGGEPSVIVAAVSGGADSTALLLALADLREYGFEIHAAHVNHHLRGADSDADEAFVRDLCARLGITLHVADGTLDADRVRERGIEAAAREVRYARLHDIRETARASVVATAHQKNDQAETVLMRLLTGTGIAGIRGIHPLRDDGFARPLLDVPRDAIDAYLRERGIEPRHDRSNDDPRFLRNRVRLLVRELGAVASLAALADQARALWPVLERAVDEAERACADVREHETRFHRWPDDPWLRQALLHRHIHRLDPGARDVSANDLTRLAAEIDAIKRVSVTKSLELIRKDNALVLRNVPRPTPEFEVAITPDSPAYIPELAMTVHLSPPRNRATAQPIQVPSGGTFTVRNRRGGDRFNSKKLKDFLIDRKIAADLRDRIPLLVWNDEIVWVAGVEVSERFKVTSSAGHVYEVWLEGS
jgi:tRNA(Ile)-lysidine synthase